METKTTTLHNTRTLRPVEGPAVYVGSRSPDGVLSAVRYSNIWPVLVPPTMKPWWAEMSELLSPKLLNDYLETGDSYQALGEVEYEY